MADYASVDDTRGLEEMNTLNHLDETDVNNIFIGVTHHMKDMMELRTALGLDVEEPDDNELMTLIYLTVEYVSKCVLYKDLTGEQIANFSKAYYEDMVALGKDMGVGAEVH